VDILTSFLLGTLYGISLAAPPGPILAMMAQRTIISYLNGISVGFGAMTADFIFMIITLLLYGFIKNLPLFPFYIIGSLFMMFLIYSSLKSTKNEFKRGNEKSSNSYLLGLGIALVNPLQIGWWLTAGLTFISLFGIISVVGFFTGIIIWVLFFAFIVRKGYSINRGIASLAIKIFSIGTFFFFASYFMYIAIISLI
jgi:threonine/homoserine/homoserine lactone efflux protein